MSSNQQQTPVRDLGPAPIPSARRGASQGTGAHGKGPRRPPRWAASAWVRLPILFALMLGVDAVVSGVNSAADGNPATGLLVGLLTGGLALAAYVGLIRYLEGRRVEELAPQRARRELGRGFGLGVGLFVVTIGLLAATGGYHVHGWGSVGGALTSLGLMTAAAVTEELALRGALFRVLEEKTGTVGALVASGIIFGCMHLVNPHATIWGALSIAVEGGVMLGSVYAATRSLWPVIGLHLGWNLAEQGIFDTTVSGSGSHTGGLLQASVSGPQVLSGGTFGPEAGIFAILVCAVPTVIFLTLAKRRNRLHPRPSRARALATQN